jgi:hypothetical protein
MQDAALFFRHQAFACFRRRRKYPFQSNDWRQEIAQARSFIRVCRANLAAYSPDERRRFADQLAGSSYDGFALGPRRRRPLTHG